MNSPIYPGGLNIIRKNPLNILLEEDSGWKHILNVLYPALMGISLNHAQNPVYLKFLWILDIAVLEQSRQDALSSRQQVRAGGVSQTRESHCLANVH